MAAFLRWMGLDERVPHGTVEDRLNQIEFYNNNEFSQWYRFIKKSVIYLKGKVGPVIKHGSERNSAVPPLLQLLGALPFYTTGCFQMVDVSLLGVHTQQSVKGNCMFNIFILNQEMRWILQ